MKIAIFTEIYDCGGVDTFLVNLINHWPHKDDSFIIIANKNYPGLDIVENNVSRQCEIIRHTVPVYANFMNSSLLRIQIRNIFSPVFRYLWILYDIIAFRKLLFQASPDVLMIINGGYPGGDSCRAAGISWGLFSSKPHSVHNFHNIVVKAPWYFRLQEYVLDSVLCRLTSHFVTVSDAAAKSMIVRPKIYVRKITSFIHNGIAVMPVQPAAAMSIRKEMGISDDTPLCLMLGTYESRKGHYFLFQAFKKVLAEIPHAHLLICGFGFPHEIMQVRRYVSQFQLEHNVSLMDFRKDVSHLLSNADVLVVASQSYESFGFTSVEAMAHRVPVVATNNGGIPEVVVNNDGGYCVESTDVDSYARCIIALLQDKRLRQEQGEKGYARYRKYFTAERMSAGYASLLHTLNERK